MEYRVSERNCFCRLCDREITKNSEKVIAHYSHRNKGQHIFICRECVSEMFTTVVTDELNEKYVNEKL